VSWQRRAKRIDSRSVVTDPFHSRLIGESGLNSLNECQAVDYEIESNRGKSLLWSSRSSDCFI
jgi:hypothetical protein